MRVAVISDIHGNLHALTRVLEAIELERPDEVWCLGDVVGYGPRPDECTLAVRGAATLALAGNHDLGVLGRLDLDDFSPEAAVAAQWTRGVLGDEARAFLASLAPEAERSGACLVHASPRDPVWEYVLTYDAAAVAIRSSAAPVTLVGHSHIPLAISLDGGRVSGGHSPGGAETDLRTGRWLLNPGSVGQPRDRDPQAAWLLLDLDTMEASYRRTPYDVEATQAEMRSAGLPEPLAQRLTAGV